MKISERFLRGYKNQVVPAPSPYHYFAMSISVGVDNIAFEEKGLAFAGGAPQVVLLMGPEEREVTWTPTPGAKLTTHPRLTPLGLAAESVSQWEFMDGLRLEWHVTRLSRWPGFTLRAVFNNVSTIPVRLRRLGLLQSAAPALKVDAEDWCIMAPFAGRKKRGEGLLKEFHDGECSMQDCLSLWVYSEKSLVLASSEHAAATLEPAGTNLWRIRMANRVRGKEQMLRLVIGV